jgi:hypothetical protein
MFHHPMFRHSTANGLAWVNVAIFAKSTTKR